MTNLPPEIQDRRARAKTWLEGLQSRIFAAREQREEEAPPYLSPEEPGRCDQRPGTRDT